jgi:hypothetical protein
MRGIIEGIIKFKTLQKIWLPFPFMPKKNIAKITNYTKKVI